MYTVRKITVGGVLQDGLGIGLKNAPSLIGAAVLWFLTCWIPYLNVGTTIALSMIPIELSKGKIISPTFIFDAKYRRYMGEYFTLMGLMMMSIFPALMFLVVPGYIIAISWSLALYIMLDKGVAPGEALIRSNNATYGYKWTIFFVYFIMVIALYAMMFIFFFIPFLGPVLSFATTICFMPILLGCASVIYKNLTSDAPASNNEPAPLSQNAAE